MAEKNMLVTIGIPCYNVGKYIYIAIKSVLAQTYANFELIIIDDGSTDNTVEEIKKISDHRVKLIIDGENRGISYRLNQQINMARGEIFVRMDGDDLMFPTRVEEQVNFLLEHPEVDVVGSEAIIIDENNHIIGLRQGSNQFNNMRDLMYSSRFIHPTVAGRTVWFRELHYKERYNGCEDRNLWFRGFKGNNMYCMEKPLFFYRDSPNLNLKTYLFRMKQGRIMRIEERNCLGSNWLVFEYVFRNYIKIFFVLICYYLGGREKFVGMRNTAIDKTIAHKYQVILNSIIS